MPTEQRPPRRQPRRRRASSAWTISDLTSRSVISSRWETSPGFRRSPAAVVADDQAKTTRSSKQHALERRQQCSSSISHVRDVENAEKDLRTRESNVKLREIGSIKESEIFDRPLDGVVRPSRGRRATGSGRGAADHAVENRSGHRSVGVEASALDKVKPACRSISRRCRPAGSRAKARGSGSARRSIRRPGRCAEITSWRRAPRLRAKISGGDRGRKFRAGGAARFIGKRDAGPLVVPDRRGHARAYAKVIG